MLESIRLRGLYAVTPDDEQTLRLCAKAEAALQGGVRLLQYRNKRASAQLRHSQASQLQRLCHAHRAVLIINDDLALALTLGADGVHLGREDGDIIAARQALGPNKLLGVSCYADLECAAAAVAAGADYIAFGSMYLSTTKPEPTQTPLALLGEAQRRYGLPVAAIGGINLANARQTIDAGADMLSVVSDLFDAADIVARAREYQQLFAWQAGVTQA